MQRAYDNLIHDVAIQKLPVVLCLDRAGIVGSDGATHHGAFDLAYLRCIPNLIVSAPRDEIELRNLMFTAQKNISGPYIIRYPRGKGFHINWKQEMKEIETGKGEKIKEGKDLAILTLGTVFNTAQKAIEEVESNQKVNIGLYDLRFLKPLDETLLHEIGKKYKKIITIEDGVLKGGFGSSIVEFMSDNEYTPKIKRLGIPDKFIEHGTPDELYALLGLDKNGVVKAIREM